MRVGPPWRRFFLRYPLMLEKASLASPTPPALPHVAGLVIKQPEHLLFLQGSCRRGGAIAAYHR
jgi:hypothetical protein